ncbi:MAG: hypothetical protein JXA16_12100, partial [Bacteroidales bacterium]|nr:hypothetical protein [Bacteroidales bacterium]
DKTFSAEEQIQFEEELYKRLELMREYQLHLKIDSFMTGKFMSENSEKDDYFKDAEHFAKKSIDEYQTEEIKDIKDFINKSKYSEENKIEEQVKEAETEIYEKGIDLISAVWVKDWKAEEKHTDYINEIKFFIASEIKTENINENQDIYLKVVEKDKKDSKLRVIYRKYYVAASIAAIFIISISLWNFFNSDVSNSELFASYYKPYNIVSEQTRSIESNTEIKYEKAITLYK